jgi:hypothetical protein
MLGGIPIQRTSGPGSNADRGPDPSLLRLSPVPAPKQGTVSSPKPGMGRPLCWNQLPSAGHPQIPFLRLASLRLLYFPLAASSTRLKLKRLAVSSPGTLCRLLSYFLSSNDNFKPGRDSIFNSPLSIFHSRSARPRLILFLSMSTS